MNCRETAQSIVKLSLPEIEELIVRTIDLTNRAFVPGPNGMTPYESVRAIQTLIATTDIKRRAREYRASVAEEANNG